MVNEPSGPRETCDVCNRSLSPKSATIHDGTGCIFCRGDPDE